MAKVNVLQQVWDEEEDFVGPPPGKFVLSAFLLYAFLPIAWMLGLCTFLPIDGNVRPVRVGLYVFIHFFLIFSVVVWPVTNLAYKQLEKIDVKALRVFSLFAFFAIPIAAFACYQASFREVMDFHEVFLAVVPAATLAAITWEETRKSGWVTLILAGATFIPIFLCNDVLGPFAVLWKYASSNSGFYLLRSLWPILAVGHVLVVKEGKPNRKAAEGRLRNFCFGLLGLCIYGMFLYLVVPAAVAVYEKRPIADYLTGNLGFLINLPMLMFLLIKRPLGYHASLLLCAVEMGLILSQLFGYFTHFESSFWDVSWLTYSGVILVVVGALLKFLLKPEIRALYQHSPARK
jgi:hypothetical protein